MLTSAQSGAIATLAGKGEPGYAGDGGPAVSAALNEPKSLAVARGCLFVADSENHAIRRIDLTTGIITTIAGHPGGTAAGPATGVDAAADMEEDDPLGGPSQAMPEKFAQLGDLSGTVRFVVGAPPKGGRFAGDGGPAPEALLNFPSAVALDQAGHLFIADTMNHRIRRVDLASGIITTVAGTGAHRCSGDGGPAVAATLNDPSALALDAAGNLYIADQSNNRVRRVDAQTGVITTVAGTGQAAYTGDGIPGPESGLAGPSGLAFGPDGALYIADTFNGRIRRLDLATGLISTVVGDGGEYRYQGNPQEFSTSLSRPYGIAVESDGSILITDSDSHLIRRWDRRRKIVTLVAGSGAAGFAGDGGPARESSLNYPFGVAIGPEGTIYIADTFNHRIRRVAP